MPQSPSLCTPMDTTPLLPKYQSWRWSLTAFAAENTELFLRAFMTSAPRFCTVSINLLWSHYLSTRSWADLPSTLMEFTQGYCVTEWFPKMMMPSTSLMWRSVWWAIWWMARLWSSRVRQVMFSGFTFPWEEWCRMWALVFAGFAITTQCTSGLATSKALPCSMKMLLFLCSRSLRSMPGFLGNPPKNTITSASLNISLESDPLLTLARRWNAQSLTSMMTPLRISEHCGRSNNRRSISLSPKAWPVSNNGMKAQAMFPAAPVTHTFRGV